MVVCTVCAGRGYIVIDDDGTSMICDDCDGWGYIDQSGVDSYEEKGNGVGG